MNIKHYTDRELFIADGYPGNVCWAGEGFYLIAIDKFIGNRPVCLGPFTSLNATANTQDSLRIYWGIE